MLPTSIARTCCIACGNACPKVGFPSSLNSSLLDEVFVRMISTAFLCFNEIEVLPHDLRRGDRVRVVAGSFAGIEGELVRIAGHRRVVVRIDNLFTVATVYIPGSYLEKI